jgi:thiazole synthase
VGRPGPISVKITLNGDPFEVDGPLTVATLLIHLDIDARRVAVEHNLIVLKRATFERAEVRDGDQIEIVNFVGGGQAPLATAGGVAGRATPGRCRGSCGRSSFGNG